MFQDLDTVVSKDSDFLIYYVWFWNKDAMANTLLQYSFDDFALIFDQLPLSLLMSRIKKSLKPSITTLCNV